MASLGMRLTLATAATGSSGNGEKISRKAPTSTAAAPCGMELQVLSTATTVQTVEEQVAAHVSNFTVQVDGLLSNVSAEFKNVHKRQAVACERTALKLHELPSNFRVTQAAGHAAARLIVRWYKHQFRSDPRLICMLSRLAANDATIGAFNALEVTTKQALQASCMQTSSGKQATDEALSCQSAVESSTQRMQQLANTLTCTGSPYAGWKLHWSSTTSQPFLASPGRKQVAA